MPNDIDAILKTLPDTREEVEKLVERTGTLVEDFAVHGALNHQDATPFEVAVAGYLLMKAALLSMGASEDAFLCNAHGTFGTAMERAEAMTEEDDTPEHRHDIAASLVDSISFSLGIDLPDEFATPDEETV